MKRILSRIFTTIGFCLIILGLIFHSFPSPSYAEDLELIGKEIGLVVEPENTKLFNLSNLNPGDTETAALTIRNNYRDPFSLYMRAERMGDIPTEREADLFDILTITVKLRGEVIYEGPIKNFAKTSIYLGKFNSGSVGELVATVHLPGPETGNEYQGKSAEVKWIFIAESSTQPPDDDDEPDKPDKPDKPTEKPEEKPIEVPVEEVPKGEPEKPIEEPVEEPEEPIDEPEEIVDVPEEEVPKDKPDTLEEKPKIPKTGELPIQLFHVSGSILIVLGIYMNRKNNN